MKRLKSKETEKVLLSIDKNEDKWDVFCFHLVLIVSIIEKINK